MQKVFLTSDIGCSKKVNGVRITKEIENKNGLVDQLKSQIGKTDTFVFVASSPDNYEKNDSYANGIFQGFKMSGFDFNKLILIDDRYNGNIEADINQADVVFLSGGHTPTEMAYFEKINLKDLLKDYQGVIIGLSAGSLNLAETVVCSPEYEEEIGNIYTWKGLGKTNINVEPHFTVMPLDADFLLREELLKISLDYPLYALCDGSHIFDNGNEQVLYGEAYYIDKGKITNICHDGETLKLRQQSVKIKK